MSPVLLPLAALAVGLLGLWGGAVQGTELATPASPLLVVVEVGAGAGCDAASVRTAIEGELKVRVAAPKAPPVEALAAHRSDILLVAIDHERIVVTLRGQGDRVLTRSIAAPGDRSGKLRAVAWLAGNVARDQLATLTLPATSPAAAAEEAPKPAPANPPVLATAPPPVAPPPLPIAATASRDGAPVVRAAASPPPASQGLPRWTFGVTSGVAAQFTGPFGTPEGGISWGVNGQIEAQRRLQSPIFVGAALDAGPVSVHPLGAALLAGAERRSDDLFLAASLGMGLEAFRTNTWAGDVILTPEMTLTPAPYARVAMEGGFALGRTLDFVARLNGHLTLTEHLNAAYAGGAIGLRMKVL
jgi:hypothetical protein